MIDLFNQVGDIEIKGKYPVNLAKRFAKYTKRGFKIRGIGYMPFLGNIKTFNNKVVEFAKQLKPSKRNELEIVDLLKIYKKHNKLTAEFLGRGGAWLDTGSIEDFYKTTNFVSAIENQQGFKIACLEEIALNNKWIKKRNILEAIKFYGNCEYSKYLKKIIS